ncbi:hypothetical protein C5S29_13465 [ANME-1 cluster archaeon GoMg3.2]|nr:hypothetical protein [ANME-1 cluster archaeon GoMg3.2]
MTNYDLVAPCGDYCGGCGQYNGLFVETAKQMSDFAALYGFEFRSERAFDFKQFVNEIHLQNVASLRKHKIQLKLIIDTD